MVVVSSRFEKFQVKSRVSPRPDFFKVTTSRFEFLESRSEPQGFEGLGRRSFDFKGACLLRMFDRVRL